MTIKQKGVYLCLVVLWIIVNLNFWFWWFHFGTSGNICLYILMSCAFFYTSTLMPSFFTFFLGYMRRPEPIAAQQAYNAGVVKRVAVITLTVPGAESLDIVKRQLKAMASIHYPHDSWILVDKEHSPEIESLAHAYGVQYFSRHQVERWGEEQVRQWNLPHPPFKAKTKAGNVNSWLDEYGEHYSHFTQLDIDHIPCREYLDKVLGFFLDPHVKWVQAPSIYGNFDHWTARGSAEQEFVLQGPLQMGFYGFSRTPFIIGSHCTYDMQAIRQIGGFQPTRAEDHLDTVLLAAQGYEGVYLPEVIAVGDGPENFETYLAQQFAWAFSMIQVLFHYTPKCLRKYSWRQGVQFLFVQTWYTFWSLSMLILFALPIISLLTNQVITRMSYWQFLLHSLPLGGIATALWIWSYPWHFPRQLHLSWRGIVLHIARWPVVLSAFVQVVVRVQKPYMITPKGVQKGQHAPFSLDVYANYFLLVGLAVGACWFNLLSFRQSAARFYLFFALQGAGFLFLVYTTDLLKGIVDMQKEGILLFQCLILRRKAVLVFIVVFSLLVWTALIALRQIIPLFFM
ncbi:hypothetical protein KTT_25020 [Tengunoibacter tsumagoiensis]|uniref:Glycosyltransferase 2-like domain-containing protein n=2 Tax=Tengunoibacter tsumagoiensis TaxID=2014871 RepID=A0A402A0K4_9CHLR|nr:hypothetical protein KTT_25020 [Tengunoibacter tsumagoiensis]